MTKSTPTPTECSDAPASAEHSGLTFHGRRTYDNDAFLCKLDEYHHTDGTQFLHASILFHKFDTTALKNAQRRWHLFRQLVKCPVFASPRQDDAEWENFIANIGFKPLQKILCNDDLERPLYIHTV